MLKNLQPMIDFVKENHSWTLFGLSIILTAIPAEPGFVSLAIMHPINIGLLLLLRYAAANPANNRVTGILLFLSVSITAVMTRITEIGLIFEIVNFFVLVWMWAQVRKENQPPQTKAA